MAETSKAGGKFGRGGGFDGAIAADDAAAAAAVADEIAGTGRRRGGAGRGILTAGDEVACLTKNMPFRDGWGTGRMRSRVYGFVFAVES